MTKTNFVKFVDEIDKMKIGERLIYSASLLDNSNQVKYKKELLKLINESQYTNPNNAYRLMKTINYILEHKLHEMTLQQLSTFKDSR